MKLDTSKLLLVAALTALVLLAAVYPLPTVDRLVGDIGMILNLGSNAYLPWRLDPALVTLSFDKVPYALAALAVFTFGNTLLLRLLTQAEINISFAAAVLISGISFLTFGADSVLFATLCWSPFLASCAILFLSNLGWHWYIITVYLCLRTYNASGPLLFIPLALALFQTAQVNIDRSLTSFKWRLLLSTCATVFVIMMVSVESLPFPDYPPQAHLVPDDGIPGITRGLFGVEPPIPIMDRQYVKEISIPIILVTLISALLLRITNGAAILLIAVSIIDSLLPEKIAYIGPVAATSRVIPNLALFPLLPFVCIAAVVVLSACAVRKSKGLLVLAIVSLCVFALYPSKHQDLFKATNLPIAKGLTPAQLFSPSYYSLRTHGVLYRSDFNLGEFHSAGHFISAVTHNGELAQTANVLDGDRKTRLSWSRGQQLGDEWIRIEFKEPMALSGFKLALGDFSTDFPSAFTLKTSPKCRAQDFNSVVNIDSWQGPLKQTKNGYFYFDPQSDVSIAIPSEDPICTVEVHQTGKSNFDWSIAEIQIARR